MIGSSTEDAMDIAIEEWVWTRVRLPVQTLGRMLERFRLLATM
jgi:hypothetical protein